MKTLVSNRRLTLSMRCAMSLAAVALVAACGGGGSAPPPATSRFEATSVDGVAGIRDNSSGITWAAKLETEAIDSRAMPTTRELLALADSGLDVIRTHFPFVLGKQVQSSESVRSEGVYPWVVNFSSDLLGGLRNGEPSVDGDNESNSWRVLRRPGSSSPAALIYNADGFVLQGSTLMWRLCSEGSSLQLVENNFFCVSSPTTMSHDQAKANALSSSYGGYRDWRLPTKQELQSLLQLSNTSGSLLPEPFFSAEKNSLQGLEFLEYWTSTSFSSDPAGYAWVVDFTLSGDAGGVDVAALSKSVALVRLVRNVR